MLKTGMQIIYYLNLKHGKQQILVLDQFIIMILRKH